MYTRKKKNLSSEPKPKTELLYEKLNMSNSIDPKKDFVRCQGKIPSDRVRLTASKIISFSDRLELQEDLWSSFSK